MTPEVTVKSRESLEHSELRIQDIRNCLERILQQLNAIIRREVESKIYDLSIHPKN